MITLWIVLACIAYWAIGCVGVVFLARTDEYLRIKDVFEATFAAMLALLWPLAILYLPGILMYRLANHVWPWEDQ